MPEEVTVLSVTEATTRVDVVGTLSNGKTHRTSIEFPKPTQISTSANRKALGAERIASELAASVRTREDAVRECTELMDELETTLVWSGDYINDAKQHHYWQVLLVREDAATEAALRRAMLLTSTDVVRELWLTFAAECAMQDVPGGQTLSERLLGWQQWAQENGIDLSVS